MMWTSSRMQVRPHCTPAGRDEGNVSGDGIDAVVDTIVLLLRDAKQGILIAGPIGSSYQLLGQHTAPMEAAPWSGRWNPHTEDIGQTLWQVHCLLSELALFSLLFKGVCRNLCLLSNCCQA